LQQSLGNKFDKLQAQFDVLVSTTSAYRQFPVDAGFAQTCATKQPVCSKNPQYVQQRTTGFKVGDFVQITGLTNAADLNERIGVISDWHAKKERYAVQLFDEEGDEEEGTDCKLIKEINLMRLDEELDLQDNF
jgi:hypothetical protein